MHCTAKLCQHPNPTEELITKPLAPLSSPPIRNRRESFSSSSSPTPIITRSRCLSPSVRGSKWPLIIPASASNRKKHIARSCFSEVAHPQRYERATLKSLKNVPYQGDSVIISCAETIFRDLLVFWDIMDRKGEAGRGGLSVRKV